MSDDLLFDMADKACVRAWEEEGWGPLHKRLLTQCVLVENSGWKKRTGMTQNHKILAHMKKAGSISQREALLDYSVQSLTKRISELREQGWNILRTTCKHPTTGQRYARYRLVSN